MILYSVLFGCFLRVFVHINYSLKNTVGIAERFAASEEK